MFGQDFLQRAIIWGPVILLSVTIHEFFHAWTASRFGDDTARRMGRVSLNPLVHLSLIGTLAMVLSGFRFGWAKPVPVNPMNLRNPRVADIWISFAGPLSNFGLAVIGGLLFQTLPSSEFLSRVLQATVVINITLGLFNLIPLFPLDGSHILKNLLPPRYEAALERFDQIAPFLLLLIIFTGVFWMVLGPIAMSLARFLLGY
jgi:Zn-dependent protease